jgi:hypothetical protein
MQLLMMNMTALAVAALFYLWRADYQTRLHRRSILCQRVAFLLWNVAGQIQGSDSGLSATCRG